MSASEDSDVARLLAIHEIHTILANYCHALDRCDRDLLRSVYWPDGRDDHGIFVGNAMDWVDFAMPLLTSMDRTVHQVFNVVISFVTSTQAKVQSNCMGFHELNGQELVVGSRFLDEFERRDKAWRILERIHVVDWKQERRSTSDSAMKGLLSAVRVGARLPNDPSFVWFRKPFGTPLGEFQPNVTGAAPPIEVQPA